MKEKYEVISLDPTKAWPDTFAGMPAFKKITTHDEVQRIQYAQSILGNQILIIGERTFSIMLPEIYDWDLSTSTLTMSFCDGENLEAMLVEPETHEFAKEVLNSMLCLIISKRFFWYDFAPRNILVSADAIYLLDFEKGLDTNVEHLKLFLRKHVFEEYSSFIFPHERIFAADYVYTLYDDEKDTELSIETVKAKRFKAVAAELGYTGKLKTSELLEIQKLILIAQDPYISETGTFVFPRVALVEMLESQNRSPEVYANYAKLIAQRNGL